MEKIEKFVIAIIKHIKNKLQEVDSNTYQKRILNCFKCESRSKKGWKCTECGCSISLKAKWASESCPLGKWELSVISTTTSPCGCSN